MRTDTRQNNMGTENFTLVNGSCGERQNLRHHRLPKAGSTNRWKVWDHSSVEGSSSSSTSSLPVAHQINDRRQLALTGHQRHVHPRQIKCR
jgi:hypothetical protein